MRWTSCPRADAAARARCTSVLLRCDLATGALPDGLPDAFFGSTRGSQECADESALDLDLGEPLRPRNGSVALRRSAAGLSCDLLDDALDFDSDFAFCCSGTFLPLAGVVFLFSILMFSVVMLSPLGRW